MLIGTVNGSGSQSANRILLTAIFKEGIPVSGKNIFPSNIAGLATWFSIRANKQGFLGFSNDNDIVVALNGDTFFEDISKVKAGGLFIYPKARAFDETLVPAHLNSLCIDFKSLASDLSKSIQLRKLLTNMIYVGILAEILGVSPASLDQAIGEQLRGKESLIESNQQAVAKGRQWVLDSGRDFSPWKLWEGRPDALTNKILVDGNDTGALGLVSAGSTFAAWYPITPSSSLAENFQKYCHLFRKDDRGKKQFAILQAEDELSAVAMVAGAGWAGARAFTTTSGPGISLMAECIGLMYFAEIPGVIWNVQRMGPSTGLPTRTSQGDLMACAYASHGDSRHPVLLPSSPKECFEMAHLAFDIAEEFQTLVFVLSDLDLGMNPWMSERPVAHSSAPRRGQVLNEEDLEACQSFARYGDPEGTGVPQRTLPGTPHPMAAYFTRGTGHTPEAKYSEDAQNYRDLLDRLDRKWNTLKNQILAPEVVPSNDETQDWGLLYYGSSEAIISELNHQLRSKGVVLSTCRVRAFPFHQDVESFLKDCQKVMVVEQNQLGQMKQLLSMEFPAQAGKLISITEAGGLPLCATDVSRKVIQRVFEKVGQKKSQEQEGPVANR